MTSAPVLAFGQAVAAKVIERVQTDGSDAPWTGSVPSGPGTWTGTNPVLPEMQYWKTWVIPNSSVFRPAPPPAFNSAAMAAQVAVVNKLSADDGQQHRRVPLG